MFAVSSCRSTALEGCCYQLLTRRFYLLHSQVICCALGATWACPE
jgi:hypothetical protein